MKDQGEIQSPRFLWVAALTIVVSVMAVLAVREVAVRVLHPRPTFAPLAVSPPVMDTIICVVVAIVVFVNIVSCPSDVRRWRYVATGVLIVSFAPDVLLARAHGMGATWPEAYALMIMHVVVWAVCITLLPGLAFSAPSPDGERRDGTLSIL